MRKRSLRKKGKDPDDFHIEILDFNQDREVYDGSLEENIISQVEEPGTIPVRPAPQRPQQRVQRKKVRRPENLDDFQEEKLPPSPKEKARRKRNRQLTALTYGFVALFICMMAYLVYFNQVRARSFIRDPHNARLDSMAEHIARGPIVDRNGQVLAETVITDNGEQYRSYPYGSLFAHVVGYDSKGKAGLESVFNFELLTSHASYLEQLKNDLQSKKNPGDTIVTTLDTNLQQAAAQSLGSNKGAAVAIEPDTGKVLLMYSNPTFNPESVSEQWDQLNSDPNSALLNRVTQGAYAPGSTFKIVTSLEYLRENGTDANYAYECNGSYTYSDTTIHCYNGAAHGMEDLESSFANSCNASFLNIGLLYLRFKGPARLRGRFGGNPFNRTGANPFGVNGGGSGRRSAGPAAGRRAQSAASGRVIHRCVICGRTQADNPDLEFRYCSKCEGGLEYCQDHLFTHVHVKEGETPHMQPPVGHM